MTYYNRQKFIHISNKPPSSWWENYFIFLIFLYQFPSWYLWLAFCYFYFCLPMKVLSTISLCHLLLHSTYLKSYLSTAWNQHLIRSYWICYTAISNIQQPYIYIYIYIYVCVCVLWHKGTSVYISYCQLQQVTQPHCNTLHSYQQQTAAIYISLSVSCDTKEHQYTFRTASYSRSHSHTAICYIAISNKQQPYIYHCLCHVTQRNISIHFLLPATAGHTATL